MGTLETAQTRYNQAKARLQKIQNRERVNLRKQDTRRKIILGALLMETMKRNPETREKVMEQIRNLPRETDRKLFENWQLNPEALRESEKKNRVSP